MSIDVVVPNLPESVADATLISWHKQPGDIVAKNEHLVDLETDKVVLEVTAPESGILSRIVKENGSIVLSGEVLAVLEPQAIVAQAVTIDHTTEQQETSEPVLSPSVRRLIHEHGLDPTLINGSGKDGRLTKADVLEFLNKQALQEAQIIPTSNKALTAESQNDAPALTAAGLRPEQRIPMTRLRAKIAERLLQAQQNAAMLTTFNEVNMQNVIDLRNQYKTRFEQKHEVKLGFMSFFVKASIEALKRFPTINASIDDNDIIYHGYYDIGIAVSTERGLIVPVLRDADQLDFAGIEKSIVEFGAKTRAGTLSYDDLKGGTFTITNGGIFGSMLSTPILNPPQCAILGMHAIKERPVVENGQIVIRPIMYLALSYDHRLVDGREAVQFLVTIKECLESPAHLLLNI
ncbi:MAG: 2-oxoglutarate dehydrogenase complex dihydrolipoyllysine-residue succinyltransferase [Methylococcaceae bacterium]|jgi:2-oxoglutarate dehydrogenase E2 component (dihydrolipoamide succinyltransferase)|nr:2-oxoglutarate dehydrogenase complex dihydrolipoyllysine-residue succinyltransferase [Methylococcaceae bacterium]MDZ4155358.1 2-oxoglutarate dehydrogenase complex dihydrolipoyllysine-residue succinyltransferase [Methylococcales bacterium]MDP2393970.1 2-oxoglutarate dehydrogenase complex dihydrolipoyllysine-residue succinyltransferase [Methylococcaceae bacterium]MDP3018042.1 2-oxoglutarate dehydrogenase complex dihydrolipoyllysine-residue succinyltransferase [Methylococcaceae bacterium]MDP339